MTSQKLVITKASTEMLEAIDKAAKLQNRSRSNFVKVAAYQEALKIISQKGEQHTHDSSN